ncbi:MAG: DUF6295 family protein [Acidimicrobiales bacterium]
MCTYQTEMVEVTGAAKGPAGWFDVREAMVYVDHPVRAQAEHTLNLDFLDRCAGPSARVAVELTTTAAHGLVAAIQRALAAAGEPSSGPRG